MAQANDEPGSAIFAIDISKTMIDELKVRIETGEYYYKYSPGNNYFVNPDFIGSEDGKQKIDIEEEICNQRSTEIDKVLYAGRGDVTCLPFKDESFDCYLSNSVIYLPKDHKTVIHEAYRVL